MALETKIDSILQLKRSNSWPNNYVLQEGEPGYDITNKVLKVGDGKTTWEELNPVGLSQSEQEELKGILDKIDKLEKKPDNDTKYHIEYDSVNRQIHLKYGEDEHKMVIPTDDFIKDGMITSVELVEQNNEGKSGQFLKITWNTDGEDTVYLDITTLVGVYTPENSDTINLNIDSNNKISASIIAGSITSELLNEELQRIIGNGGDGGQYTGVDNNDSTVGVQIDNTTKEISANLKEGKIEEKHLSQDLKNKILNTKTDYITCSDLGLTPDDNVDGEWNLFKLAEGINSGYTIVVDGMYKIYNPNLPTKSTKPNVPLRPTTHCNVIVEKDIHLIGKNSQTGFKLMHHVDTNGKSKDSWYQSGMGVFAISSDVKNIEVKNLTLQYDSNIEANDMFTHLSWGQTDESNQIIIWRPVILFYVEGKNNEDIQITTTLDKVLMDNCIVDGPISLIYFQSGDEEATKVIKGDYGITNLIITNNQINNSIRNTKFINITCPNVSTTFSYNTIHNFDGVILYSGLYNKHDYLKNKRGMAEISYNKVYCDDSFFRIDNDPTAFHVSGIGDATDYYNFALIENDRVDYHHNHVEGMKMDCRSNNAELYDLYANSKEVYYHHNVWKNIFKARTQCYTDSIPRGQAWSNIGRWQLIQAKSATTEDGTGGIREYCNNEFIIEEDFLKRCVWNWKKHLPIKKDENIVQFKPYEEGVKNDKGEIDEGLYDYFIKKYMPRLILTTSEQAITKIDNNIINMPNLYGTGGDSKIKNLIFTNNNIKLKYLTSHLMYYGCPPPVEDEIIERNLIFDNNDITITSAYLNDFPIYDEINTVAPEHKIDDKNTKDDESDDVQYLWEGVRYANYYFWNEAIYKNDPHSVDKGNSGIDNNKISEIINPTFNQSTILNSASRNPTSCKISSNHFTTHKFITFISGNSALAKDNKSLIITNNDFNLIEDVNFNNNALIMNTTGLLNNNLIVGNIANIVKTQTSPKEALINVSFNQAKMNQTSINAIYLGETNYTTYGEYKSIYQTGVDNNNKPTFYKDYAFNFEKIYNAGTVRVKLEADELNKQFSKEVVLTAEYKPYNIYVPKEDLHKVATMIDKSWQEDKNKEERESLKSIYEKLSKKDIITLPLLLLTYTIKGSENYIILPFVSYAKDFPDDEKKSSIKNKETYYIKLEQFVDKDKLDKCLGLSFDNKDKKYKFLSFMFDSNNKNIQVEYDEQGNIKEDENNGYLPLPSKEYNIGFSFSTYFNKDNIGDPENYTKLSSQYFSLISYVPGVPKRTIYSGSVKVEGQQSENTVLNSYYYPMPFNEETWKNTKDDGITQWLISQDKITTGGSETEQ